MSDEYENHETDGAVAVAEPPAEHEHPHEAAETSESAAHDESPSATPAHEHAEEKSAESAAPAVAAPPAKRWYIVKVQSGREDTIKNAIEHG